MNILVTGSQGFVGKNLVESLKNIRDNKDRTRRIRIDKIYQYDIDTDEAVLDEACKNADFIFHLAGVNRPEKPEDFYTTHKNFTYLLLEKLKTNDNHCPIMISSSIQASQVGRYANSDYGKSKAEEEEILFAYGKEHHAPVLVYRFPNLFGKWCKPNYNSVVATFCHNIAHDLPIQISDESVELELLYIDDLVMGMFDALEGKAKHCDYDGIHPVANKEGKYCYIEKTHKVTLGRIASLLYSFYEQPKTLMLPECAEDSFEKKLYSTYLSYLPKDKISFGLKMNEDERGSFTELLKTHKNGQFSVNISKPGITKGQHWHHSKWEFFFVVKGHGLIQQRKINSDEIIEFEVNGDKIEAVHMLPGYTHNIINLSDTEELITVMWANEIFDANHPDTYFEKV